MIVFKMLGLVQLGPILSPAVSLCTRSAESCANRAAAPETMRRERERWNYNAFLT